jgi:hypothetical protein
VPAARERSRRPESFGRVVVAVVVELLGAPSPPVD